MTAYNRGCAEGHDGEFFKDVKYMRPINTKKLYAIRLTSAFFTAFGGLNVNRDFEVLNTKNQPIKGLYATGLEVSRMIGHTYTTLDFWLCLRIFMLFGPSCCIECS